MSQSTAIELKGISKSFGPTKVIRDLSLKIEPEKITALVGESGCGKTTCLRLMNGLIEPDQGEVWVSGGLFDYSMGVETRRKMGYCLQGYTLFPHLNIFENLALIAAKSGWPKSKQLQRAEEILELVHLPPTELFKLPRQLSGGQRQRVGLGRALFMSPRILLMDEPFGALDPITRNEIQDSLMELQSKLNLTVVLVTHDLSEAFKMADQLVLLQAGKVAQQGKPNSLLTHPATSYVADFLKSNSPTHILRSLFVGQVMLQIDEYKDDRLKLEFDTEKRLKSAYDLKEKKLLPPESYLREKDDLLTGLNTLLKSEFYALPVLNPKGELSGLLTRTTLDILSQEPS